MGRNYRIRQPIVRISGRRWGLLCIIFVFVITCIISISFYVHHLELAFLNNIEFYMSEIADHDMKSVDQEIWNQWQRLETVGRKLELERYQDITGLQHFLNLETEATGFESLSLIDDRGYSYGANYLITEAAGEEWVQRFFEDEGPFVIRSQRRNNYVVMYNKLMYGVPIEPLEIDGITFIGIVGEYLVDTVKNSLLTNFFDGEGAARVVGLDGVIITTEIEQSGEPMDNLLDQIDNLKNRETISEKLKSGKSFYTTYEHGGKPYIMSAKPLTNVDWMLVVTVPYSVASSQSVTILKMTVYLLSFIGVVIGAVFIFAFVSYKRTMILKNSKEIFYRERLFNLLSNHTDDVFIIEDAATGRLNFVSENVERILGTRQQPDEDVMISMLDEPSKNEFMSKIKKLKEIEDVAEPGEHEHFEMEMEWTLPDSGRKKWIHLSVYRAVADFMEKEEACLIAVISDYTQVKKNRTELEAAIRKAQEAAQSKSLFLSNMSHEMRTPLNGIVGCIRVMKENMDDPGTVQEYLKKTESTADYMVSLINDILDMSKIENHKLKLEEREVSIKSICSNMEIMFRSQMEEKGISFSIEVKEPLRMIQADEVRVQQILVNLLSNAQKFTNSGGKVTLHVSQVQERQGSVKTIFTVGDTGIGMSRKFLEQIFMPFEQEHLDTARLYGGTGLGLAISNELAHLMQGTISVTSELGQGSTFVVELNSPALSEDIMEEKGHKGDLPGQLSLEGRTILIAEDNELNSEILCFLLKELGAKVWAAWNGEEAVSMFGQSAPGEIDAVLMDMQMPVMDGCTAARHIREMDRADAKSVVIFACTANAFQDDVERAKAAGMNAHLAKPLDMEKVVKLLYDYWEDKV